MAAAFEKHVVDEQLKKSTSIDQDACSPNNSSSRSEPSEPVAQNRKAATVDHRRSPSNATQEAAKALVQMSNTSASPPMSKQNSQSPKGKPSTPTSSQKRAESIDENTEKFESLSTSPSKSKNTDQQNILSNRDDALTCPVNNTEKRGGTFRTDREYEDGRQSENQELQAWQPDPELPYEGDSVSEGRGGKGWSADEMFRVNNQLGVQSTYNGIEEYCTVKPQGDEEARREADRIAIEIESNKESQRNKLIENDDEERDLDKETRFNERDNGKNSKRQSSGFPNKSGRSQFNGGSNTNGNRNYPNSTRSSYPNAGSSNAAPNRFNNPSQSRQQRGGIYTPNIAAANPPSRQGTNANALWRNDSAQQLANVQPVSNYSKNPTKSPSLHLEERRQSASPATSKYPTDSNASVRRTNSVQNRQQQPNYSPRSDSYSQQQVDKRITENRYYDGSSSTSSNPPTTSPQNYSQVEVQPLITPIPRQSTTPQSQVSGLYDGQQPHGKENKDESDDKSKKKFTFNPDAPAFVPKSVSQNKTTPVVTPSATPMQPGIPQSHPAQQVAMTNVSHYNQPMMRLGVEDDAHWRAKQPGFGCLVSMPLLLPQQQVFAQPQQMPAIQAVPQQVQTNMQPVAPQRYDANNYMGNGKMMDGAAQQKYVAQFSQMVPAQPMQYIQPQPQYQHQIQIGALSHPQLTGQIPYATSQGMVSAPYQQAPPMMHQQPIIYSNYSFTNGQ